MAGAVVAIVDLDALTTNIHSIRSMIGPDVQLMAVVKANGYGHGAIPIAKSAIDAGATVLGVATVDEGAQLRAAGIDAPILVFGAIGRCRACAARSANDSTWWSPTRDSRSALAEEARASLRRNQCRFTSRSTRACAVRRHAG